jgi:NAD(P)-dependent dehydrogenase (short-subunit alcohol dehydrogenase family)
VNLAGAFNMTRAVLPAMVAQGGGTVINLSSGAAFRPLEGWSAYCASKAGLAMFTRSIDLEYGAQGIRAVGFAPGLVDTGMQAQIRASGVNPVSKTPRERLSDPADPARVIVWLASGGAAAHAGTDIDIRNAAIRRAAGLAPLPPG